ncbi:MAG: TAXI family TRAP transporter solute-binding subunit [Eubacteriales bacterium]
MKKQLIATTLAAVSIASLLAGCSSSDTGSTGGTTTGTTTGGDTSAPATSSVNLTLGTGGTTGTYYAVGGTMSTVLNPLMPNVTLNVASTGASKANIIDVDAGVSHLATVQNDVMYYAYNGTDLFLEEGAMQGFSAVAGIYDETCQIIAQPGITSVEDLRGMRVNVGDAGSGVEFNATQILAAYGIDINEDIVKSNGSFGDAADQIKDDRIDAAFVTAGAPTTAVVDLAVTNDIVLISIDADKADALIAEYPFYTKAIIPAGTYNGVDSDVETVSVRATLIASPELTEDTVYELTKAMFENQADLSSSHAKFLELDVNAAVGGIATPFHPGAAKYYAEVGVELP